MSDLPSPRNLEAERAVLGGCLVSPDRFDEARALVSSPDFFRRAHQIVYQVLCMLADENQPLDVVLVNDALRRSGDLNEVGGEAYVLSLVDGVPRSTNVAYYARIVRETADLRAIQAVCASVAHEAGDEQETAAVLCARAVNRLESISAPRHCAECADNSTLMLETAALIDRIRSSGDAGTGARTGLDDLDSVTRGVQPGQLVLLAARPGAGKSALALLMAMEVATTQPVAFYQLEMSRTEMGLRMLAIWRQLNLHQMASGYLRDADYQQVADGLRELAELRLFVDDTPCQSVASIRSSARELHKRHPLGLVVIDYLQLLEAPSGRQDTRATVVGTISRGLKRLARDLEVPVLALSQLNRQPEARPDKRPHLSDLRESGSLEQDADMVWLLHRPGATKPGDVQTCEVIVAKHRQGPTGSVTLRYIPEQTRFESLNRWETNSGQARALA